MSATIGRADPGSPAGSDIWDNGSAVEPSRDAEHAVPPYSSSMQVGRVTVGRVIRSEWVKL